jgi:hypothetical protein
VRHLLVGLRSPETSDPRTSEVILAEASGETINSTRIEVVPLNGSRSSPVSGASHRVDRGRGARNPAPEIPATRRSPSRAHWAGQALVRGGANSIQPGRASEAPVIRQSLGRRVALRPEISRDRGAKRVAQPIVTDTRREV